jgi:hypothetical protein
LSPAQILAAISALRSNFRYVSLEVEEGDALLLATDSPAAAQPVEEAVRKVETDSNLADLLKLAGSAQTWLTGHQRLTPTATDRYLARFCPLLRYCAANSNSMSFDYSLPKAAIAEASPSFERNLKMLTEAGAGS